MAHADFELSLRRQTNDSYAADADFRAAGSRAISNLAANVPVHIDTQALIGASLDAQEYGHKLAEMLFADARLKSAWQQARANSIGANAPLSLRLHLDMADDTLHGLRWETLHDPDTGTPLCLSELIRFSRYLDSPSLTPVSITIKPEIKALVVVANPSDLDRYALAPVDVDGEVARARTALGDIPTQILAYETGGKRATLANLSSALRDGPHILYLVCHGQLKGVPHLWLEQEDGTHDRVSIRRMHAAG